jgi:serine/threonine protein kinase
MEKTLQPGTRLGKYEVLAHIATGGMGAVYKAIDRDLHRLVALKVLVRERASNPAQQERFRREARHSARLNHKNIVTLYECQEIDGFFFLAMEYVDGIDLETYIRRKGKLHPELARYLLIQATRALEHAHQRGVIHRDIKPSNFMLARENGQWKVKLTDLGLAWTGNDADFRVTRAGSTVGTVDYLSPEQARDSSSVDIRSDIYSLGCTLYHMLAGHPPFPEGGLGERILKHQMVEPRDIRKLNPDVPDGLWFVLRKMLAKSPGNRYQTPTELKQDLKHLPSLSAESAQAESSAGDSPDLPRNPLTPTPDSFQVPTSMVSADSSGSGVFPCSDDSVPSVSQSPEKGIPQTFESPVPASTQQPRKSSDSNIEAGLDSAAPFLNEGRAATGQFQRAREAADLGNLDYAIQLLLSCCKLDPSNIPYRKTLREVAGRQDKARGWFSSLTDLTARRKVRSALRAGDYVKALDEGEQVLIRHPGDLRTNLLMAAAAAELDFDDLAVWLLKQVCRQEPDHVEANRALGRVYEKLSLYKEAIQAWERVHDAVPHDAEAPRKINELAVRDTLNRGRYLDRR